MGHNMSLKLHFLHSHLDFLSLKEKGTVLVEYGGRLHQTTSHIEERVENAVQISCLTAAGVL